MSDDDTRADGQDSGAPADLDRRAALAKMGKFAGVTAPAVVALLTSNASDAWATSGRGGRPGRRGPLGRLLGLLH